MTEYNKPLVLGDDQALSHPANVGFKGQGVFRDNRNIGRRDVSACQVGDLWKPWYYFKDRGGHNQTNAPVDVNNISLVYKITEEERDPKTLHHSCFIHEHRAAHRSLYYNPGLAASLQERGQVYFVDCVTHYTKNAPVNLVFKDGSTPETVRVFEGHHRTITLETMGRNVLTRTFHLYDMREPVDINQHYNSIYDDSFWSPYQTQADRRPWFQLYQLQDPSSTHKYSVLRQCFDFVKQLGIQPSLGIDVGCGEGAYTAWAAREFETTVLGIDSESGQILRGLLGKMAHNLFLPMFRVADWDTFPHYDTFDFALALSVTHHMVDPIGFVQKLSKNKKFIILEARHARAGQGVFGSIKRFQTFDEIQKLLAVTGMQHKEMGVLDGDRHFYVLWR